MFFAAGIAVVLGSVVHAAVWTTPYRFDEITPLAAVDANQPTVYRDIMVGTHLVLIVSSDSDGPWTGALYTSWEDASCGALTGRGYVPVWQNYDGSCLKAAGWGALVWDYQGMGAGFELSTADKFSVPSLDPFAGDWFIFDYHARAVGSCRVTLYSGAVGQRTLTETLSFTHVVSRDFDDDKTVDFEDLALLTLRWRTTVDSDPNSPSTRLDLNSDQQIGAQDLALFSEYWLEQIDSVEPTVDPNELALDPGQSDHGPQPSTTL
jgi:hypothetical protein